MALSALYSQHVHTDLPKACHSILHSPATSIKEKEKHLAVTCPLLPPIIFCPSFISSLPPIISLFQICNLLFIFFLMSRWPWLSAPY